MVTASSIFIFRRAALPFWASTFRRTFSYLIKAKERFKYPDIIFSLFRYAMQSLDGAVVQQAGKGMRVMSE